MKFSIDELLKNPYKQEDTTPAADKINLLLKDDRISGLPVSGNWGNAHIFEIGFF